MILEPCNLLILDEPTNHLDIASCEALTQMLSQYGGTLLVVSHDRYLLNAVSTKTLALIGDGRGVMFEGNYAAWRDAWRSGEIPMSLISGGTSLQAVKPAPPRNGAPQAPAKPAAPAAPAMNARELSKARIKARETVEKAEALIARLEARIAEVEAQLAAPSDSPHAMVTLAAEHTRLQEELMDALANWEKVVAEQEALG
jgi:energy-coupling factor transporter ATP-binding protein EcfA2